MLLRIKSDSVCERTYPSTCHTATKTRFPSLLFSVVSKLLTHMGNQWMVSKVSGYRFSYCESLREEDMRECWGLRQGGKLEFDKKIIQILREVQTRKERSQRERVRAWLELSSGAESGPGQSTFPGASALRPHPRLWQCLLWPSMYHWLLRNCTRALGPKEYISCSSLFCQDQPWNMSFRARVIRDLALKEIC